MRLTTGRKDRKSAVFLWRCEWASVVVTKLLRYKRCASRFSRSSPSRGLDSAMGMWTLQYVQQCKISQRFRLDFGPVEIPLRCPLTLPFSRRKKTKSSISGIRQNFWVDGPPRHSSDPPNLAAGNGDIKKALLQFHFASILGLYVIHGWLQRHPSL